PAASGFAALLAELRPRVLALRSDPEVRRRLFADWADPRWLELWQRQGPEEVRRQLVEQIERLS
ncbi:hypothetical protein ACYOEI_31900, partial [Singulisphaera rosea]